MTDRLPKLFLTSDEVADLLQMSRSSFNTKRDWLERDHDFPAPMPHSLRPLLWRRSAILAWVDRQGLAKDDPALQAPPLKTRADRLLQKAASA
ncbi:helix-turn-helix transcriptional regulator [Pseudooceanicola sp. 200-1SW]|uniref:helix-turn-helix transcriptional regulator n=1 Tax=Pseudooceanicola sp. 200-1SW TaxID=3425949 RepID=UPI003D7F2F4F